MLNEREGGLSLEIGSLELLRSQLMQNRNLECRYAYLSLSLSLFKFIGFICLTYLPFSLSLSRTLFNIFFQSFLDLLSFSRSPLPRFKGEREEEEEEEEEEKTLLPDRSDHRERINVPSAMLESIIAWENQPVHVTDEVTTLSLRHSKKIKVRASERQTRLIARNVTERRPMLIISINSMCLVKMRLSAHSPF